MSSKPDLLEESELKKIIDDMDSSKTNGYIDFPMPCEWDENISRLIRSFLSLSDDQKESFRKRFQKQSHSDTLLAFSQRMAVLGFREQSKNRIYFGLLAHAIEGCREGRENVMVLSLLNNSAQKIKQDPVELFDQAAAYSNEKTANLLKGYVRKPVEEKTIAAMEYAETTGPDGFNYKRVKTNRF